jgi:hypothetical protein
MDANNTKHGAGGGPGMHNVHGVAAEPDRVPTKVVVALYGLLAIAAIASAILVFILFRGLESRAEKKDRAAIAEAGLERPQDAIPPPPRLQIHPVASWEAFRDAETKRLSTYGWMDRASGAVHVPVERAMDLVLERGVGPLPPAAMTVPVPQATPAAQGAKP